jgi:hypothetical protein
MWCLAASVFPMATLPQTAHAHGAWDARTCLRRRSWRGKTRPHDEHAEDEDEDDGHVVDEGESGKSHGCGDVLL